MALLIPIAIAAIDILINSIPPPPVSVSNAHIPFNAAHQNPYKLSLADQKKLITHQMLRSPAGDFKAAWNKVVAEHPRVGRSETAMNLITYDRLPAHGVTHPARPRWWCASNVAAVRSAVTIVAAYFLASKGGWKMTLTDYQITNAFRQ